MAKVKTLKYQQEDEGYHGVGGILSLPTAWWGSSTALAAFGTCHLAVYSCLLQRCRPSMMKPGYADEEKVKMVVEGKAQGPESIQNALEQPETIAKRYTVQTRQCRVCLKPQLLRMKHCYECELCVATFDHHCIWIENCVGEKNRPLFFICVVSNLIAVLFGFCQLVSVMWDRGEKKTHQLIFLSFAGIVLSALCLLFGLHGYLMCANVTTWQVTRWEKIWYLGGRSRAKSPFSQGLFENVKQYWRCGWQQQFKLWRIQQEENVSETSTQ